ncbi:MAG: DEAD/DEAH box helicase [Chthoniobacterales bacterium]|nr:DEAD/DEAH box helicase [Chthoniobacterales bacterium]
MPFRTLGLNTSVLKAIAKAGYVEPTPIQVASIPIILEGKDLIGIAQTGTGKTAAFVLPLLTMMEAEPHEEGYVRVLVVAPTRELVVQIEENVRAYATYLPLKIATIYGGVSERPQIKALTEGVDIVIATPGRLLDLIRGRERVFSKIKHLVLDEADRMLDMGFVPAIRQIVKLLPRQRQTLFFSATLSLEIEKLTQEFLNAPKIVEIGRRSNPAETVTQYVYEVSHHLKQPLLIHLLKDAAFNMVLIFTRTKHGADRIARRLEQYKITTATLHSNRSQNQRLKALQDFKDGKVRVLVATDIAARGIDVDGISHVVNYDFPPHHEDYIHRIGRTGRAKAIGEAISFVMHEDHGALRSLERFIGRGILRKKAEGFDTSMLPSQDEKPASTRHRSGSTRSTRTPPTEDKRGRRFLGFGRRS